ncbi:hypothetical protein EHP00_2146 [Ecytonucleospora hepatopenaei]|uniref:Uncharacterized protein n=1 Tax=Ecytonucleospora hepatopenaei TaxID=646526 RepID=A0A1W0E5M7_9MICR|nr:hypothetical protein EHP00_2146 [Ecytonucleospora hepatopenaei]
MTATPEETFEELKKSTTKLSEDIQDEMEAILKKVESLMSKIEEIQKDNQ